MGNIHAKIHPNSKELEISFKNLSKDVKKTAPDTTLVVNNYEKIRKQVVEYLETNENLDASLIIEAKGAQGLRDIRCFFRETISLK